MGRTWVGRTLFTMALLAGTAAPAMGQLARAYVANRGAASVTVADVTTGTVLRTIPLDAAPYDVAVTRERVFVSIPSLNRLAVIDPVSLTVIGSVTVPGAPRDLDGRHLHDFGWRIHIATDDGVRVYDWSSNALSPAIAVGAGQTKAIDADLGVFGDHVYVAACDGGAELRVLTEASGTVSAPVSTGAAPCAVEANTEVWVANTADDTVTVFTRELQPVVTVPVADQPIGLAATDAGIFVASASGTLTLINHTSHAVQATHAIGGTPTAIATNRTSVGPLPAPDPVLLVTDAAGSLRVFSLAGALLRSIPTGAQPGGVGAGVGNPGDPVTLSDAGTWSWSSSFPREPAMSLDGRFVAFVSDATGLVPGDTNNLPDVFVRDRLLRRTVRVSVTSAGGQAEGVPGAPNARSGSYTPTLSGDGRYVLFVSLATNLVAGDTNGREDIFLHDRDVDADGHFDEPGQVSTRRLSVMSDGSEALCRIPSPSVCAAPHIDAGLSRDGRHVVFATTLEFDHADVNGLADVYVHDIGRGVTTRISLRPGGLPGGGVVSTPVINANGRFVAFATTDPDMFPGDYGDTDDAFVVDRDADGNGVYDEQVPTATPVGHPSFPYGEIQPSRPVAISDDGRWVAHSSPGLAIFDRTTGQNSPLSAGGVSSGVGQFSPDGRYLITTSARIDRDVDADGIFDEPGGVSIADQVSIPSPRGPATDAVGRAGVGLYNPFLGFVVYTRTDAPAFAALLYDTDADGLGNAFESRFGLNASSDTGADGPAGDPDGDGRTNLEEQLAGTHPRGLQTRYLAEGASGSFFQTRIAIANPSETASRVLLRYLTDTGQATSTTLDVPGRSRRFVDVGGVASLQSAAFSTVVEADTPVVVDRSMSWNAGHYGSHAETSVAGPSTTWFLAEGATHGAFDLFYLLQNPDPSTAADVEIRFLRSSGPPIVRTYRVPAARRLTVYVDGVPGLDAADVSAAFTSLNAVPIIVERAMYYSRPETPFAAGHASAAVTAPATQWFLAEGATGPFFNLFVLLANPSANPADIRLTYLRATGDPIVRARTLAANSRLTLNVAEEDPALGATAVSTVVESLNSVGIVAERAMWWPAGNWQEAHNSPGATTTAARWGFADGGAGGPFGTQTYFLVANTSTEAATVRVTLLFDDGTAAAEKTFAVPANSRFTVPVGIEFPGAAGKGFGAVIESLGASPVPIVVERAMYSNAGGTVWAAGTDALGTPLP